MIEVILENTYPIRDL